MSETNDTVNPFDPTGMFKQMQNAALDSWSKMMIQVVNSDAYAEATAAVLDSWLAASVPFRKATESAMNQALAALNMPTRTDVTGLGERLTNIELRLDDLDAKLDRAPRPNK